MLFKFCLFTELENNKTKQTKKKKKKGKLQKKKKTRKSKSYNLAQVKHVFTRSHIKILSFLADNENIEKLRSKVERKSAKW